jgi:hypothetical protein
MMARYIYFDKFESSNTNLEWTIALAVMAIPVVEFSREGYKIKKVFFAKNQQ